MRPRQPLTPAMMRTRYHEHTVTPSKPADPELRPPLGADAPGDAVDDWLAHIAASRIPVLSDVEGAVR